MKNLIQRAGTEKVRLKYISDLPREAGVLFGHPLPRLPQGDEVEDGQKRIFVDFPPNLGVLLRNFLQAIYSVTVESSEGGANVEESFGRLRESLLGIGVQTIQQERRNGLTNLFYVSLSKMFGEIVHDFFSTGGKKPYHKYLLHPKLSAFFSRIYTDAVRGAEALVPGSSSYGLGPAFNDSLIQAILNDQLPLVTTEAEDVSVQDVLGIDNPRFPISLAMFKEIHAILTSRLRKAIDGKETSWLEAAEETSGLTKPIALTNILGVLNNIDLARFLLMDYALVGKKILSSKVIKGKKVSGSEIANAYIDVIKTLKRNELVQLLKKNIIVLSERQAARAEDLYGQGSLYRYYETGRIVNETRNVTTVFMDLRGFTKKSEEAISASELTDELYAIFDPMTSIVKEFHGKIDKFTGDGMMITFGVESRSKEDPLNALRMAVRFHDALRNVRQSGKTMFHMGISIHSGLAFVSNFIAGDERVDNTVIGRNVNIAGRLSSAGDVNRLQEERREFNDLIQSLSRSLESEQEKERFLGTLDSRKSLEKSVSGVSVDANGNLYNLGIVLSRQAIQAIERVVELQSAEDGDVGYLCYFDPVLSRQISLYYVGDAKFKGVESSFPIYAVLR